MSDFQVDLRRLIEFDPINLYDMLKLRTDVFVVEQRCPYPELDGRDVDAWHLRLLDSGLLAACARILPPTATGEPAYIGRVVVSPAYRRRRLGEKLMVEALSACTRLFPGVAVALGAQSQLRAFYGALGFQAASDEYLEDGVPHLNMLKPAA